MRRSARQAPASTTMGASSSQPNEPQREETEESVERPATQKKRKDGEVLEDEAHSHGDNQEAEAPTQQKKKKRKRRRPSTDADIDESLEDPANLAEEKKSQKKKGKVPEHTDREDQEAQTAVALLQLKKGGRRFANTPAADDDDLAASNQLQLEISPTVSFQKRRKNRRRSESSGKFDQTGGQDVQDTIETSRSMLVPEDVAAELEAEFNNSARTIGPTSLTPQSTDPQRIFESSHPLDDIRSDDEDVATFLEEYQNEAASQLLQKGHYGSPGFSQPQPYSISTSNLQRAAAAALWQHHKEVDTTMATQNDEASPIYSNQSVKEPKQRKKKGKKRNQSAPEEEGVAEALESMRQQGHTLIDPNLTSGSFLAVQMDNYQHSTDPDQLEALRAVRPGKIKPDSVKTPSQGGKKRKSTVDEYMAFGSDDLIHADVDIPKSLSPKLDFDNGATQSTKRRKKRRLPDLDFLGPVETCAPLLGVANHDFTTGDTKNHGGPFTSEESAILYAFRDSYCAEHDLTHTQFAERIQANARNIPNLGGFWTEVCTQLPHRGRQPIQKFCRRQFHNFEKRGAWTAEDDEELRRAVAEKGKSWKAIGESCGRMAEDVRDRYRNYIHNSENRNSEGWTKNEIKALCRAVGECIWLVREDRRKAREAEFDRAGFAMEVDDEIEEAEAEKLVVWQSVSDRMGGSRGRLQCSYKWKQLKLAGRTNFRKELRRARRSLAMLDKGLDPSPQDPARPSWREMRARNKILDKMLPGDQYDFLEAVINSGAPEESELHWNAIGNGQAWRARWTTLELKVAWDMMKESREQAMDLGPAYVDLAHDVLATLMDESMDRLEERYDPANDVDDDMDGLGSSNDDLDPGRKPRTKGTRQRNTKLAKDKGKPSFKTVAKKGKGRATKPAVGDDLLQPSDEDGPSQQPSGRGGHMFGMGGESSAANGHAGSWDHDGLAAWHDDGAMVEDDDTRMAKLLQEA